MGEIIPCRGKVYCDAWPLFGKSAAHEGNVVIGQHFDDFFGEIARKKGFEHVASGPLVRSSYHAADFHPVVPATPKLGEGGR